MSLAVAAWPQALGGSIPCSVGPALGLLEPYQIRYPFRSLPAGVCSPTRRGARCSPRKRD